MVTLSGQRLGDYDIGAFRFRAPAFTAYTGRHRASGLEVGVLHGACRGGVDFGREFARLKALRAPGLPLLIGWGEVGLTDRVILTGPLGDALWSPGEPRIEWVHALSHLNHLSECLGDAADAGFYHSSLTPECIRRDPDGEIVIAGIGATRLFALTQDAMNERPRYLAPEQLQGRALEGASIDIYTLGLWFYAALLGQEPFAGADLAHLPALAQHGAVEPLLHKDIPIHVNSLIRKMTAKDGRLRLQEYADVIDEIAAVFVRASQQNPDDLKRALVNVDPAQIKDPAVKALLDDPELLTRMGVRQSDEEPGSGPRLSGSLAPDPDRSPELMDHTEIGDHDPSRPGAQRGGGAERDMNKRDIEVQDARTGNEPIRVQLINITPANDALTMPVTAPERAATNAALRPRSGMRYRGLMASLGGGRWMVAAALLVLLQICITAVSGRSERAGVLVHRRPILWALPSLASCPPTASPASRGAVIEARSEQTRGEREKGTKRAMSALVATGPVEPGWRRPHVDKIFELEQ